MGGGGNGESLLGGAVVGGENGNGVGGGLVRVAFKEGGRGAVTLACPSTAMLLPPGSGFSPPPLIHLFHCRGCGVLCCASMCKIKHFLNLINIATSSITSVFCCC